MEQYPELDAEIMKLFKSMKVEPTPLRDTPERITTGSPFLDWTLGGGLARERLQQFYGEESAGKSLLAEMICAKITQNGGRVVFVDAENSYNHARGGAIGIVPERFVLFNPQSGEDALKAVNGFVSSKLFDLIVIDSIPALSFLEEADGSLESKMPGYQASKIGKFCRVVNSRLPGTRTAVLVINQLREKIGVMFGSNEYFPGGRGLRHTLAINLKLLPIHHIVEGASEPVTSYAATKGRTIIGHVIRFRAEKNKTSIPGREGYTRFLVDPVWGVDVVEEYAQVAHNLGLFCDADGVPKKDGRGGFHLPNGDKIGTGSGIGSVIDAMYNDDAVFLKIKNLVDDFISDESSQQPVQDWSDKEINQIVDEASDEELDAMLSDYVDDIDEVEEEEAARMAGVFDEDDYDAMILDALTGND